MPQKEKELLENLLQKAIQWGDSREIRSDGSANASSSNQRNSQLQGKEMAQVNQLWGLLEGY